MFKALSTVRRLSTSGGLHRSADLIQATFVKKIRDYAQKAASGQLLKTTEVENMLDDELNRLANKFHLDNAAAVREIPTKFEVPEVENAVQKILEGKNLDDLIADVKKETAAYMAERKAKAEEEARRAELLDVKSDSVASFDVAKAS